MKQGVFALELNVSVHAMDLANHGQHAPMNAFHMDFISWDVKPAVYTMTFLKVGCLMM